MTQLFKRKVIPMPCKVKNKKTEAIHQCTEALFIELMTKRLSEFEAIEAPEEILKQINIKIIANDPHKKILGDKQDVVEINPLPEEESEKCVEEDEEKKKLIKEAESLGVTGRLYMMRTDTLQKKIEEAKKEQEKNDIKNKLLGE